MTVAATQSRSSESRIGAGSENRAKKVGGGMGTFEKKELTIYGERPWGFTLNGGCHYFPSLIVTKVSPDGKAAQYGLECGDLIEAVNGEQCRERRETVTLIHQSTNILHLTILRFPNREQLVDTCLEKEQQSAIDSKNSNEDNIVNKSLSTSTQSPNMRNNFKLSHAGNSTGYYINKRNPFPTSTFSTAKGRLSKSMGDLQTCDDHHNNNNEGGGGGGGDLCSLGKENYGEECECSNVRSKEDDNHRYSVSQSIVGCVDVAKMGHSCVSTAPDDISHSSNHKQLPHSISCTTNTVAATGKREKETSNGEIHTIPTADSSSNSGGGGGINYYTRSQSLFHSPKHTNGASNYVDSQYKWSTLRNDYESGQSSQEDYNEFDVPAFSVYPRRHSLGYSLEIITQKEGSSDVLPKCTVFDSKSPHQISVPENFLKRRSVIVKSDTPSALFRDAQKARRRLEKSTSYETFSQFEEQQPTLSNETFVPNNNTAFNKHGANKNIHKDVSLEQQNDDLSEKLQVDEWDSSPQPHAPTPPTRRSSMNVVAEMAQKGVWSRNTNAVAKVPQRESNLQNLNTLKEKETSDDISLRLRIDNNSKVMQETNSASWFQSDFDDSIKEAVEKRDHKHISSKDAPVNKQYPDINHHTSDKNKSSIELPVDSVPPPIPARESSKSINFANYTNANIAPSKMVTSLQNSKHSNAKIPASNAPVPVARKRIVVDPLTFAKTPVPGAKTSRVDTSKRAPKHSAYSPFHKPLPSLPQEISYSRRGSESALNFARRSTEAEFVDIREPSPEPSPSIINRAITPGQQNPTSSQVASKHSKSMPSSYHTLLDSTSTNWSQSDDRRISFSSDVVDSHFHSGMRKGISKPFLSSTPLPNQTDGQNNSLHSRTNSENWSGPRHHFSSNRRSYFLHRATGSTSGSRPPVDNPSSGGAESSNSSQGRFLSDPSKMKEATEEAVKVRYSNKSDPQIKTVEKVVSDRLSYPNDSNISSESVISEIVKASRDTEMNETENFAGLSLEELCSAAAAREEQLDEPEDFNARLRRSLAESSLYENKQHSNERSVDSSSQQKQQQEQKGVESIPEKTDSLVDQKSAHLDGQFNRELIEEATVNSEMSLASLDPIANCRFGEIRSDRILAPSKRSGTVHTFTSRHVKELSNDSGNGKDASDSALQLDFVEEDDADEHLAGSTQSQFQIAKNRFLRKQNDSIRSSQTTSHMSRSSLVSRRDNSLRSRIAKSTENVIRAERPTDQSTLEEPRQRLTFMTGNESSKAKEGPPQSAINRKLSQSAANLSEVTGMSDLTVDSGIGGLNSFVVPSNASGAILSRSPTVVDDVAATANIIQRGSVVTELRGSKASIASNSRTMSSDDLSLSVGGGGYLSRGTSLDNLLLPEADFQQVQSALSRVSDLLTRDRMELANLSGTLLDQSHTECQQIVTALQKNGRESDVKRFHRYLESLCTSCKLAVHEENRLSKLDQRLLDLSTRAAASSRKSSGVMMTTNELSPSEGATGEHEVTSQKETSDVNNSPLQFQPQHSNIIVPNTKSQKSMEKEVEQLRKSMEKQKAKVSEAQLAFEDAETTLVQHLEKALKNCTEEEVQSSKHKIENRVALTRKICLCESSIKHNQDIEKYLNKQLITSCNQQTDESSQINSS